jgi:hypothetical protein
MKEKTVGHIMRAIARAHKNWKAAGEPVGCMPNWYDIVKRHFEMFGKSIGKPAGVIGPFGLRCAFSVKIGRRCREFEIGNDEGWHLGRRDYKVIDHSFPPGSIGAINDMQYKYVPIPNSATLKSLFGLDKGKS